MVKKDRTELPFQVSDRQEAPVCINSPIVAETAGRLQTRGCIPSERFLSSMQSPESSTKSAPGIPPEVSLPEQRPN